ncbi:MAG: dCMP deaminase family protein [Gemmatales bacterium]
MIFLQKILPWTSLVYRSAPTYARSMSTRPNRDQLRHDITRIVSLWFGDPYVTPTFDEHAMFMAFASALRSADMSRQVGAVVTIDSQILSTGANDCPKAQGGLYWPNRDLTTRRICDTPNGRDYMRKAGDSNRAEQLEIIDRIVERLKIAIPAADEAKVRSLLDESPLRDLTEYGRVVHAEMEALLCCSRNGLSTIGTTLYCTTFPCHNCAKHIIAAGVKRVVYVEPYPKSKALDFHEDAICPPGLAEESSRVKFDAFVGIGPRRFFDLFSMNLGASYDIVRKNSDGTKVDWTIEKSRLRIQMKPTSYLEDEANACRLFGKLQSEMLGVQEA